METAVEMIAMLKQSDTKVRDDIAIIGMSALLPGAQNIDEYWSNIQNGLDSVANIPPNRSVDNDNYVKFMGIDKETVRYPEYGYLDHIDKFDYDFFRVPPKEASLTDPHQRIFLEQAWKTIEDAGYGGGKLAGSKTGVYLGYTQSPKDLYAKMVYDIDPTLLSISTVGNMQAMTASRISYFLNLKGPALVVDTACSSALIAIGLACQAIKQGQCDMALAGGVKLNIIPIDDVNIRIGIESSDWRTRTFDDAADGSGVGEGAGAVLLKPLKKAIKDGDHIYAVIKGDAANHDGTTAGITVPNPTSQSSVLQKAWEEAGIDPQTLDYIETHGTGTKLGDPIEIKGIEGAFRKFTDKKQFCAVGSVKTNIGHLSEAAGIASLIKMALSIKNKKIPPSIYFQKPNKAIGFSNSPLYVNTKLRDWTTSGHLRRGGVSGFGMSGTNCHLVLEEAPVYSAADVLPDSPEIFTISAKSMPVLRDLLKQYINYMKETDRIPPLSHICFTANTGRGSYSHRLAFIATHVEDFIQKLQYCYDQELETLDESWACYGYHKMARANSEPSNNELSEQQKKELSSLAEEITTGWNQSERDDAELLGKLCSIYVNGAEVNWDELYEGEKRRRVSLPTYPFQSNRCWIDFPERETGIDESANTLYYEPIWTAVEGTSAVDTSEGAVLIYSDNRYAQDINAAIVQECNKNDRKVIIVTLGDQFEKHSDFSYTISNKQSDYESLLNEIGDWSLSKFIHLMSAAGGSPIESIEQLEASQHHSLISFFYFYQAWNKTRPNEKLDIVLVTEYAHEVDGTEKQIKPENATLYGLGKVMAKEHPAFSVRSIDRDAETELELLTVEIMSSSGAYGVAYRKGVRYIEQFTAIDINNVPEDKVTIKDDGVYVITGGAGGIGLEVAKSLSKSGNNIVLALVNRSELPERETWDNIIADGKNLGAINKIIAIREIEQLGAKVHYYQANASNEKELSAVLDHLRSEYKAINGVIHAAGIAIDQFLAEKQEYVMREVLLPKVNGTWLLNKLTEQDNLDFFVMFSSVATIFSGVTQGDYVAANAYMDAFTHYRNRLGKKTLTINWTTWKETGMAAATGAAVQTIFKTMPTARGIEGFTTLLNKKTSRALIGEFNFDRLGIALIEKSTVKLSKSLEQQLEHNKKQIKDTGSASKRGAKSSNGDVRLIGRDGDTFSEAEKRIASVCKEVLGYDEIDIYDNFFELGADSILLMRIHSELDKSYPNQLTVADMFEHSTISKLANYIISKSSAAPTKEGRPQREKNTDEEIAIIGMSFRLPMAESSEQFWEAIQSGLDLGGGVPDSRKKDIEKFIKFKGYPPNAIEFERGTYLEDIDKFDYRFFRLPPKEASTTDPHHRLFLQSAWHAIEDAGYGGNKINGTNTGVYLGFASAMVYYHRIISEIEPESEASSLIGNTASIATGRVSYLFDLKGPSVVVDTACSSSLTAVHLACKSIRMGDCDMAIAGGVKLNLLPIYRRGQSRGIGMESVDGKTRTFDHYADGTGSGEGVAAIVLKPLKQAIKDRDQIYAVIKGSASNQDGSSVGLTAPNPAAQEAVMVKAWEDAAVDPETISYLETHGTATVLGDPIEIQGIQNAFKQFTNKKQFCAVGSSKSNITHLGEAAGIAGVIKAVLALKNKEIPPNIYFNRPNRKIDFNNSPIYVNTTRRKWETDGFPRRCGVSGFGMSGTNCHVVLEEYAEQTNHATAIVKKKPNLLTLSAHNFAALQILVKQYKERTFIDEGRTNIHNICYTANTGRGQYAYRLALIVESMEDLNEKLSVIETSDLEQLNLQHVYYGYHKVVSESKSNRAVGEIVEKQRIQMNKEAEAFIAEYVDGDRINSKHLERLSELFISGAEVNWEELYVGEELFRISLPTYPYEKERCWIETPEYEEIANEVSSGGLYYAGEWIRQDLPAVEKAPQDGPILIFLDEKGLGEQLTKRWMDEGKEVVKVYLRDQFKRVAESHYHVSGTVDDYVKLLKENKHRKWSKIIHLFSVVPEDIANTWDGFQETQLRGLYSLFYFTKAVATVGLSAVADMVIISDNVDAVTNKETIINPWNASLFALGKSVRLELPNLLCRCIDIDDQTAMETVIQEMNMPSGIYQVAYRENERYVEKFKEYAMETAPEQPVEIKQEGVYLITGGTGGMGVEVAKYLAAKKNVNIALLNRTPMPDKHLWDGIVSQNSRTDYKIIERIKSVREIEAIGATVTCFGVDIADRTKMEDTVNELREKYGRINGVVHGAGVGGEGFLYIKDELVFNAVVHPKITGTWILDKLTEQDQPDFFVMFSSMSSRFAVPGQGDYAAANAFLDAYSKFRSIRNKKTLSINWVVWKETGMGVEFGVNADGAFKALTTARAMKAFDEALNKRVQNVLVGEINFGSDILWELDLVPQYMDTHIEAALKQSWRKLEARQQASQKMIEGDIKLTGKDGDDYDDTEAKLAEIYCQVLGFNEIDIYDNFFELGGDSILLSRVHVSLEKLYPGRVRLLDLFEYTSIYKLYHFLKSEMVTEEDDDLQNAAFRADDGEQLFEQVSAGLDTLEDTKKLFDDIYDGSLSIEQAIDRLTKPNT